MTFGEAVTEVMERAVEDEASMLDLFRSRVLAPLNAANTPHSVKEKALELLG